MTKIAWPYASRGSWATAFGATRYGRRARASTLARGRRLESRVLEGLTGCAWASAAAILFVAAPAAAWDPFLVENAEVADGNEQLAAGNARAALSHYDRAARALPDAPGVHLNRGLALLEAGELDRAREAFLRAAEPPAEVSLRADAYYDLGLAFYRQGDAAAAEEDNTEEATRLFREAADAFRRSLRLRPGTEDAGWNLELALRRIREQEEREEQERQEQEQQQQDQDQQQQDQQDQQQQDRQDQQDQQDQQQDQQDQQDQQQDQQDPQQDQESQDQEGPEGDQESDQEQESEDPSSGDEPEGEPSGEDGEAQPEEQPSRGTEDALPQEHRRVLDALSDSEENLERHRARARAARENRRVEQDW